jgi:hypothetical protein
MRVEFISYPSVAGFRVRVKPNPEFVEVSPHSWWMVDGGWWMVKRRWLVFSSTIHH